MLSSLFTYFPRFLWFVGKSYGQTREDLSYDRVSTTSSFSGIKMGRLSSSVLNKYLFLLFNSIIFVYDRKLRMVPLTVWI